MAETSEERVGQHEFPSLLNLLGNGLINIISGERADSNEQNDASQPHFTTCGPGNWLRGANTNTLLAALVNKSLRCATKPPLGINFGSRPAQYDSTCLVSFDGYRHVVVHGRSFSSLPVRVPFCMSVSWSRRINLGVSDTETGARTLCTHEAEPSHLGPRRKFLRCLLSVHGSRSARDKKLCAKMQRCANITAYESSSGSCGSRWYWF